MHYNLYKKDNWVGSAVIMSENNVVYHLFDNIRLTRYCTEKEIRKKFKLVLIK